MKPARPGIWLLDTEVAEYQQAGMQTLFNVAVEGKSYRLLCGLLISPYEK